MTTAIKYIVSKKNTKGFTLLEVMISVSIIALIFVSLFRMQSGTIGLATAGKFNITAPMLARQLLTEIEQDVTNWSDVQGDFGQDFPQFFWTCEISDSSFEEADFISEVNQNNFKRIRIEIIDSSESKSYKFSTWRFVGE